ncbi:hypothetical protein M422DRAFT_43065 [Sphaerobolus stellatus SS14]|nr:hypothetical protein M422DRAFT_43065 [Sphaerobolus stellatus SS14]
MSDVGYPSWLPKRPPPPVPQSTVQSSVNVPHLPRAMDVFGMSPGRKATPRSVRIVARDIPWREREPTGDSAETRVHLNGQRRSMTLSGPPQRPRPRFRAPSLHLDLLRSPAWSIRIRYLLHPVLIFAHLVLQTYFDFNVVFILLQFSFHPGVTNTPRNWTLATVAYIGCWVLQIIGVFIIYELIYSFWRRWRVKRPLILPIYLNSAAHDLAALTSYSNFCFLSYIRRSARPSIRSIFFPRSPTPSLNLPQAQLGSSPPLSASPHSPTPPPVETASQTSSSSSASFILFQFSDYIAEKCYWRAQNWPTVALLIPRAALCVAALLQRPAGPNAGRDTTYFDTDTGALSGYAKGILLANAAWTAWRFLVMIGGIIGLWMLSGTACGGLCGPRYRWEEEADLEDDPHADPNSTWEKRASRYSDHLAPYPVSATAYDADDNHVSDSWAWKRGTRVRVREAWEFCLTARPVSHIAAGKAREIPVAGGLSPDTPSDPESPLNARTRRSAPSPRDDIDEELGHERSPSDDIDDFAALEEVIRNTVLERGERYRRAGAGLGAVPREGLSDIIPPQEAVTLEDAFGSQRSRKSDPLRTLPFPFPGSAASPTSPTSGSVPFPADGETDDEDEVEEEEEEEEEDDDDDDDDEEENELDEEDEGEEPISPRTRRTSDSLSSLGRPVGSYPFVGLGNQTPQSGSRAHTNSTRSGSRRTHSSIGRESVLSTSVGSPSASGSGSGSGSRGRASNYSSPGLIRNSQGTRTHSTPSTNPVSSPAHTHSTPSTNPASTPAHTNSTPSSNPASSPSYATPSSASHPRSPIPETFISPPPMPVGQRRRRRGTGPGLTGAMDVAFPVLNEHQRARTRTMSSGVRSDDPEPVPMFEEESDDDLYEDPQQEVSMSLEHADPNGERRDSEDGEMEDIVGLLSTNGSRRPSVSPRPSLLGGLRARTSSGALSGRSARSRKESGSSYSNSNVQETRSRTQSLIQRVTEFGVVNAVTRGRSRSSSVSPGASGGSRRESGADSAVGGGSGSGSDENRRESHGSGESRRVSSGVEESSGVESGSLSGEGGHAPGVDTTFGRPGELRRQVEEARSRMASTTHLEAPSVSVSTSTSLTPSLRTAASHLSPSLRSAGSYLTARGPEAPEYSGLNIARSVAELSVAPSEGDLSTAHDSFVTAPMSINSTTSGGTIGPREGGLAAASAWTLRERQDSWGHGQHGPL